MRGFVSLPQINSTILRNSTTMYRKGIYNLTIKIIKWNKHIVL